MVNNSKRFNSKNNELPSVSNTINLSRKQAKKMLSGNSFTNHIENKMYGRKEGQNLSDLGMSSEDFSSPHNKTFMPDVTKSISIQEDSMLGMNFDKTYNAAQATAKIYRPSMVHSNISKHVVVSPKMRRSTYK